MGERSLVTGPEAAIDLSDECEDGLADGGLAAEGVLLRATIALLFEAMTDCTQALQTDHSTCHPHPV